MSASWLGLGNNRFRRRDQPVDDDGTRLRAAIEADAASGAVVTGITRRVHSVGTQFGREFQAFRRAGLNTEPASFALLDIDRDIAACWACHIVYPCFLIVFLNEALQPVPPEDAATISSSRNIRRAQLGNRDARSRSAPWPARESTCRAGTQLRIRSRCSGPDRAK